MTLSLRWERAADTLLLGLLVAGYRGGTSGKGGFKTEMALLNYKCNKVSNNYSLAHKPATPKTERYSLALPCINTKDT